VHTAIEALDRLNREQKADQLHLTIAGSGHPAYEESLRASVESRHLQKHVTFSGPVPSDEMPAFLQGFDVLLFPSIYQEPLARMTQEAMAAGLLVIGTTTGGTKELLVDGQNGLTFEPEDATQLASQIALVTANPVLRDELVAAGRQIVREHFTQERMMDQIEAYLGEVARPQEANLKQAGSIR
jgi:glycosyltransferase involved in cell wall biosynthesis